MDSEGLCRGHRALPSTRATRRNVRDTVLAGPASTKQISVALRHPSETLLNEPIQMRWSRDRNRIMSRRRHGNEVGNTGAGVATGVSLGFVLGVV